MLVGLGPNSCVFLNLNGSFGVDVIVFILFFFFASLPPEVCLLKLLNQCIEIIGTTGRILPSLDPD